VVGGGEDIIAADAVGAVDVAGLIEVAGVVACDEMDGVDGAWQATRAGRQIATIKMTTNNFFISTSSHSYSII